MPDVIRIVDHEADLVSRIEVVIDQHQRPHLINFEWLQHGAGANQIFPSSANLVDAAGRTVMTSCAAHRPDGE